MGELTPEYLKGLMLGTPQVGKGARNPLLGLYGIKERVQNRPGRECTRERTYPGENQDYIYCHDPRYGALTLIYLDVEIDRQAKTYPNGPRSGGDDVGTLRQHTEFSGSFYSIANNTDKVDRNHELLRCKSFFWIAATSPIFWFSQKIFYCHAQLRDANSLMSTCNI